MTAPHPVAPEARVRVHQVALQKAGGYNLVPVREFLALPSNERVNLILSKKVQFLDAQGKVLPLLAAVKSLGPAAR